MGLEQFEHLLPEQRFQVSRLGPVGHLEPALIVKATIRGNDMQVRVEDKTQRPVSDDQCADTHRK